ncbi:MAG TPA: RNHCP domain-containing protein [Candidatus Methylomirabilis sp.]|nr:RNHCP domain-containing protein [Candidatus Methylomirabilis sp.]
MAKKFQRKIEDFVCENCGAEVKGNGYTNHCPHCLWSKHVDINPGDRAAVCGGLMKPVDIEQKDGQYILIQRCQKCEHVRKNKTSPADDVKKIIELCQKK